MALQAGDMAQLQRSDLEAALYFAAELAEAPNLGEFVEHAMTGLHRLVPAEIVSYNEMDAAAPRAFFVSEPADAQLPGAAEALARHLDDHPIVSHVRRTGETGALKLSDFLSRRALHRTSLHDELYRPVDVEYLLAANLRISSSVVVGIGLFRNARDFGERDRQLLDLLQPHLVAAYRNVAVRAALPVAELALERSGRGALALGPDGEIAYASPAAERMLAGWFGWGNGHGRLFPRELRRWLSEGGSAPFELAHNGSRLTATSLGDGRLVLAESRVAVSPEDLRSLPLTPRQREVLALAAAGLTAGEIAGRLAVAERTARKHLADTYERLGVRNRAQAVAVALRAMGAA